MKTLWQTVQEIRSILLIEGRNHLLLEAIDKEWNNHGWIIKYDFMRKQEFTIICPASDVVGCEMFKVHWLLNGPRTNQSHLALEQDENVSEERGENLVVCCLGIGGTSFFRFAERLYPSHNGYFVFCDWLELRVSEAYFGEGECSLYVRLFESVPL